MHHAARVLLLIISAIAMASAGAQERLWSSAQPIEQSLSALSPAAVEAWQVSPRSDLVEDGRETLALALPGRAKLQARIDRVFHHGPEALTWTGTITGEPGHVLLARRGEWISGVVHTSTETWEIRPDATHGQVLMRLDPAGFPACGGGIDPGETMLPASTGSTTQRHERGKVATAAGDETMIDLLVVYSEAARQQLGGATQIEAHAQAAVDNGNLALGNSLTNVAWNIVEIAEIAYDEVGSCGERLGALRNSRQAGHLRDRTGADMVGMLLADGGGACGCGFVMRNPGPGFAGSAFQVTANGCAVGNLTFAHEHGHNSGMEHDPDNGTSPGNASHPWSFGHFVDRQFRTVMSYSNPCSSGCPRRPYFSNPDVTYENEPTGIEDERHNALTASLTAPIIAEFRARPKPKPELDIAPPEFDIALLEDQDTTMVLTLSNNGSAELAWEIGVSPARLQEYTNGNARDSMGSVPWLDFGTGSGSIAAGDQVEITFTVDTIGLEGDQHEARIDIFSNDPEQPEASVPVTLQILGPVILRDRFQSNR